MRLLFILLPIILSSQNLIVNSSLDTTDGFIGDIINWTISVEGKEEDQIIVFPDLDYFNNSSINIDKNDSKDLKNNLDQIHFEITIWDTGTFFTPDYFIEVYDDNNNIDYIFEIEPVQVSISSILSSFNENEFRPIKGPVPVKGILPLRKILLISLLVIISVCMAILWRKREKFIHPKIDYHITENPDERAKRRLNELDENGLTKDYYTKLSHISREFIETKYFIRTLEMTTYEIEKNRILFPFNDSLFDSWLGFLHEADKVKYARVLPKPNKLLSRKEIIFNLVEEL